METEAVTTLKPNLLSKEVIEDFHLDDKDIKVIEILMSSLIEGKEVMKGSEILRMSEGKNLDAFRSYKRLIRLCECGILEAINFSSADILEIMFTKLKLSNKFLTLLFEEKDEHQTITPYRDNYDYLVDQFKRIELINEFDGFSFCQNGQENSLVRIKDQRLAFLEGRIAQRLAASTQVFPLEELKKKKRLTNTEEIIVIALLLKETKDESYLDADELSNLIARSPYEKLKLRNFIDDSKLKKSKIIEVNTRVFTNVSSVKLNEKIKRHLLCEKSPRSKIKKDDLFEIVKPKISLAEVILHPRTFEEVTLICEKMQGAIAQKLREWGIHKNKQNQNNKRRAQPAAILFYGLPGTGKTLTANAIATQLRKELLILDCSKILDQYVGLSEKNTRRIFDRYHEIARNKRNPPILLLNEADQFLHKRIEATRSTDHMYNQMQNIFLEQMENFNGILIATTNLPDSMDSAFSRRFDHKVEFRRPRSEERFRLWQVHIPDKVPLDENVDLFELATRYDLSGGQISLIVRNAVSRAVRRGDQLSQEDLVWACTAELAGTFDEGARISIGFK